MEAEQVLCAEQGDKVPEGSTSLQGLSGPGLSFQTHPSALGHLGLASSTSFPVSDSFGFDIHVPFPILKVRVFLVRLLAASLIGMDQILQEKQRL